MQRNNWTGEFAHWWLADALKWRIEDGGCLNDAFKELRALMTAPSDRRLVATAIACKHACPMPDIQFYETFRDPPTTHPKSRFALAVMPPSLWADVLPITDEAGRPTSDLKCALCRLPAWLRVEFLDRYTLVNAWRPNDEPLSATSNAPDPNHRKLARYEVSDRALFGEIERLMRPSDPSVAAMSLTAATEHLAIEGRVQGNGASQSIARRLRDAYNSRDLKKSGQK